MRCAGLVVGLVCMAVVAGCGGGKKASGTPAAATTTKAAFIAKADALCAEGKSTEPTEAQIASLLTEVPLPRAHVSAVLSGAATAIIHYKDLIAALPRPSGDAAEIGTWLSEAENVAIMLGQLGREVSSGDTNAMGNTETSIIEATGDPLNFAATYGLTSCSSF
jgi:hypothetical protein